MPDKPDLRELVEEVAEHLTEVRWPPGAELRARVRRRRQRSVAAAAALVTALTAGAVSLAARPDGDAAPPPAVTPSPTAPAAAIPEGTMLRPEDVGGGPDPRDATVDAFQPMRLEPILDRCVRERGPDLLIARAGHTRSQTHLTGGAQQRAHRPFVLTQTVYRFEATAAAGVLPDLRAAFAACDGVTYAGDLASPGGGTNRVRAAHSWTVVASGFAGDDALVVAHHVTVRDAGTGAVVRESDAGLVAYVRVGDLISHIEPRTDADLGELTRVTAAAAARMCTAASPPC